MACWLTELYTFSIDLQSEISRSLCFQRSTKSHIYKETRGGRLQQSEGKSNKGRHDAKREPLTTYINKRRTLSGSQSHNSVFRLAVRGVAYHPGCISFTLCPPFSLQRYFFLDKGILKYGKCSADVSTKACWLHTMWLSVTEHYKGHFGFCCTAGCLCQNIYLCPYR